MDLVRGREGGGKYMSVSLIQVSPLGYFTRISITTQIVSAMKNCYCIDRAFSLPERLRNGRFNSESCVTVLEVKELQIYNGCM